MSGIDEFAAGQVVTAEALERLARAARELAAASGLELELPVFEPQRLLTAEDLNALADGIGRASAAHGLESEMPSYPIAPGVPISADVLNEIVRALNRAAGA